jgi:heme/copper-type cytochrome/quinol oxidase subunit 1
VSNEHYLIVSYFVVALACLVLSIVVYLLLWRSFSALTTKAPGGRFGHVLRKLFLIGIVLPAMAGFFSVSFHSCEGYESIVGNRSYLVAKNQEQLRVSLSYVVIALLVWGALIAVVFLIVGSKEKKGG